MFNPRRHETTVKDALQSTEPQYKAPLRRTLLRQVHQSELNHGNARSIANWVERCNSDDGDNDTATTTNPDTSHYSKVTFNPAGTTLDGDFLIICRDIIDFHPASQRAVYRLNSAKEKN